MVHYKKPKYFKLSRSLKKLGRYVGRGKWSSIAQAVLKDEALAGRVVSGVAATIGREVKLVCSAKHESILMMKTKPALENFTWRTVWAELQQSAPTLLKVLQEALPRQKRESEAAKPVICMCASLLLKFRNPRVNVVQAVISLILQAGHASKEVRLMLVIVQDWC